MDPVGSFFGHAEADRRLEDRSSSGALRSVSTGKLGECAPGEIDCTKSGDTKRYVGWGLVGGFAGAFIGHYVFPKHNIIAAAAGLAGGLAYAAKVSVDNCILSESCHKV